MSQIESRFGLDLLVAESAITEYYAANAEERALRNLSNKRGALQAALVSALNAHSGMLASESALEKYRTAMAENFALRNLARIRRREALGAPLALAWNPMPLPAFGACVTIPVKHQPDQLSLLRDGQDHQASTSTLDTPSLHSLCSPRSAAQPRPDYQEEPLLSGVHAEQEPPQSQTDCCDLNSAFPSKLFHMLGETEKAGHADIISFLPDGKSFKIHKPVQFAQEILPKYFKTNRLSSFRKQLSVYRFKTVRFGANRGAIYHNSFHRDIKKLVPMIQRRKQPIPGAEHVDQQKEREAIWIARRGTCRKPS